MLEIRRVILQVRMSSTRMPGKSLMPLAGVPLAVLSAKRAGNCGHEIVVATSIDRSDDILCAELARNEISFERGELEDVLSRFVHASRDLNDDDWIARLTGDNPIPDGRLIAQICELVSDSEESDYVRSSQHAFPYGVSVELFTVRDLRRAYEKTRGSGNEYNREHVTPWIISQGRVLEICPPDLGRVNSELRATCDNFSDYLRLARIFSDLAPRQAIATGWVELCKKLDRYVKKYEPFFCRHRPDRPETPEVCLGTAQIGISEYGAMRDSGGVDEKERNQLLESAWSMGIRCFDTAGVYGDAEAFLGEALSSRQFSEPFHITSKVACESEEKHSLDGEISASRTRLRTTQIDRMLLHRFSDFDGESGEGWKSLVASKKSREVGEIGVSVYELDEARGCLNSSDCDAIQIPFNIIDHRWIGLADELKEIKVSVRSAFLQGLLLNEFANWPENLKKQFPEGVEIIEQLDLLVSFFELQGRADLCLSWLKSHSWVDEIIVGVDSKEQLREIGRAYRSSRMLSSSELEKIRDTLGPLVPTDLVDPRTWEPN